MKREILIPERIKKLFWDVDKETVDIKIHRSFIIKRIMDYGRAEDVRWMLKNYSKEEMIEILRMSRGLSRKSGYFWAAYFDIPKEEIKCLEMSSRKRPRPF